MTSYYVTMSTKHLKLLEFLSTSSCVNLVTKALTVLNLYRGASKDPPPPPPPSPVPEDQEKPGLNRVKRWRSKIFTYAKLANFENQA